MCPLTCQVSVMENMGGGNKYHDKKYKLTYQFGLIDLDCSNWRTQLTK